MAQQRIYKQPQRGRRPEESFHPEPPVGPTYDPTDRLAQTRERAARAGDTSGIDEALRQAEQQEFNPADENSYLPQSVARAEKNRRTAEGRLARGRQVERRLADQESKIDLGDSQSMYKRSREGYQQSRKRGLFIGLGAGGGILSIVAGIGFLLPFKLPGIMDTILDHAGERIERVVERRAEKVLMQFVIRGSAASVANGTVIVTGNPIGDLFANLRTAKFEERLLSNYGLKIEPTNDKRIRITHNGRSLGNFQNAAQLEEFLDRDDLNTQEIRRFFKLIVKNEIPSWRFFKRAKFVKWLRIKYSISRLGVREKGTDETDQEYRESVREDHIKNNANASIKNMADLTECVASGGDCDDLDKAGGAQDLHDKTAKAVEESAEELAKKVGQQTTETLIKTITNKILTSTAGSMIPYIGQIDLGARLIHFAGQAANNDIIQKKHAEYIKHSSAVLGASYAGYADQTKAGDMPTEVVGDFAEMFNGLEESAAYDVINGGTGIGVKLEAMEKINESVSLPAFTDVLKGLFNTVGWIGRAPFEAWYYTVSQAFDFLGGVVGDALGWIAKFGPAQALLDTFAPYMAYVFEGFFKLLGMYIDPLATGAKLFSYVHMGFIGAFNDYAKELGMRLLSNEQASQISRQIAAERAEDLKHLPITERLFDVTNHDSLASNLLQGLPTPTASNPLGSMAFASAKIVASAPASFASAITPRANAAGYVNLYGEKLYGGLDPDLDAQLSPAVMDATANCPENNDNSFNHCSVDRAIMESMNCSLVTCKDMELSTADYNQSFVKNNVLFYDTNPTLSLAMKEVTK